MRTIRLAVRYDGGEFSGWQRQPGFATVQATLEDALARVSGIATVVHGSGRTDAGVHAIEQIAHFRSSTSLDDSTLVRALNANLPPGAAVLDARTMPAGFHARKTALAKRYVYLVRNDPIRDPLLRRHAWWIYRPLDVGGMSRAVRHLVGTHDFKSFQTSGSSAKTSIRTLRSAHVLRRGPLVLFAFEADGFLYNMVRAFVGTLVEVGRGALAGGRLVEILAARDRRRAGPTAPACGLYLLRVLYPREFRVDPPRRRYEKEA